MRTRGVILASLCPVISGLGAFEAAAQTAPPGPLAAYAAANGATPAQINAAYAVQGMCNYLKTPAGGGYGLAPGGPSLTTPTGDLFLRCNELVQTASQLNKGTGYTRSLGLSGAGLFGALQQVSGVQLAAQGTLTSQVPAGQFQNISSRISALRYGASEFALRGRVSAYNSSSGDGTDAANSANASNSAPSRYSENAGDRAYYPMQAPMQAVRAGLLRTSYAADDAYYSTGNESSTGSYFATGDYFAAVDQAAATASPTGRTPMAAPAAVPNPWGLFTEGSYNFGKRDATSGEDAFNYHADSVTVGLDYNFGNAVVGATVGYDRYGANFQANGVSDGGGSTSVEGTTGSLFAAWFGQQFYFNGIVSYGSLNTDIVRVVSYAPVPQTPPQCQTAACGTNVALRGSPGGKDTSVGLTGGYDLAVGNWNLSPTLSLNYRRISIDSYRESDLDLATTTVGSGLPLAYGSQTIDSLRSGLGFTASTPLSFAFGVLSPNVKLEWDHEYQNEARNVAARYIQDASANCVSCFSIPTERPARDFGTAGVGVSALFPNRIQGYVYYERLVGVSYLTSNSITLGVRGQF